MKKLKVLFIGMIFLLLALSAAIPLPAVQAADDPPPTPTPEAANTSVEVVNDYYSIIHTTTRSGISLQGDVINGPPQPPDKAAWEASRISVSSLDRASTILPDFPSYDWVYGCSAVSGAMIAAYYDNNGYSNMYTGPTNGGVMPLTDTSWSTWIDTTNDTYPNNPLIASHQGVDGHAGRGSIDDYWYSYNSTSDPFVTNSWTEHSWGTAIGDYMKTSQYNVYQNVDGGTSFYNYSSSADPLTCSAMASFGIDSDDGTYGRKLFYEARGYTVTDCYNQFINEYRAGGFTLAQFQAEIDAGNPVLINLNGHSIVGYGYNNSTIYIRDTWDNNTSHVYSMAWGGSYDGMQMLSVSIVHLEAANQAPAAFGKSSPSNDAINQSVTPMLRWQSSSYADEYEYCYDQTDNDGCDTSWQSAGTNTSVTLPELSGDTQYFWQVRAMNTIDTTYADGGTWRSFTTLDPAILTESVYVPLILH